MKILMATMGLDIGGAETHIVELAKELKAEGHDVAIASNGGVYVPEIKAAGIRHYSVPMHRRDAGCMLRSRKLLKEIIRTERPDVVHAHARIPAFLCGTLQRTMKFPFVTTAHWVFTTKGGLRYLTNWGQRTVAVSDDIKAYLIREYGVPEEHISVTINGIDTEKFSPQTSGQSVVEEFGLDRSRPVVSYVSRMDEDRALVARQLIQIAEELDRAVRMLATARTIDIYGVENSCTPAGDLLTKLTYLGLCCRMNTDAYLQQIGAAHLGVADVAVAFSHSGCSMDTVKALKLAQKAGAGTIAITSRKNPLLARYADVCLCTGGEEAVIYGTAIFSRIPDLAVVDLLYMGIIQSDYERFSRSLDKSGAVIADRGYPEE